MFEPYGAFYVFPDVSEFGMTSEEFATRFLEEERVAVVPGNCLRGKWRRIYPYFLRVFSGRSEGGAWKAGKIY